MCIARRAVYKIMILSALVGLVACGSDADFSGQPGRSADADPEKPVPVDPPPAPPPVELPTPFASLTWFWQCDSQLVEAPAGSEEDVVVEGIGPHAFVEEKLYGTPITISGNLCAPEDLERDIVFIIDISGSMSSADPMVGGSCGRYDAVEAVIASLPSSSNFGIVLFSGAAATSSALFGTQQEMLADLAGNNSPQQVICQDTSRDGTNYEVGLASASNLLASFGRADAAKEIYFISDGQPDFGANGVNTAANLKNGGTTIATVMLGGNDSVLKNQIASLDKNGDPMHSFVQDADQLAENLEALSKNEIQAGILRYRSVGAPEWIDLDLINHLSGYQFSLPTFRIDKDTALDGIEVEYEYFDLRGSRFSSGGKILWDLEQGEEL